MACSCISSIVNAKNVFKWDIVRLIQKCVVKESIFTSNVP